MRTRTELAGSALQDARNMLIANVSSLTLDDWLDAGGGYRSLLGILKHAVGWSHVYRSYAFDDEPRHWNDISWPRGLRDTVDISAGYAQEILDWFEESHAQWQKELAGLTDQALDEARPLHWGATAPLFDIVMMVAHHWTYHAGEINAILAIRRGEAWELTEEVEENHISTEGRRVRPAWMDET